MNHAHDFLEDEPEYFHGAYRHGSEAEVGDFKPLALVNATSNALDRCRRIMEIGNNCDSPIEVLMGAALLVYFDRGSRPLELCKTIDKYNLPRGLVLVPQFKWSYYRSDWALYNASKDMALLIECDGHDYHTSPEQRAHDRKKDTAALERGYLTMRFTGSQINRDADACAQKIFDSVYGSE